MTLIRWPARRESRSLVVALAVMAGSLATSCGSLAPARPNVVVIVVDTLRADHLPLYGYARETSPFLSWLGERSVVFENAHSTSSWTLPATASLFTGVYPLQHGLIRPPCTGEQNAAGDRVEHTSALSSRLRSLPELMRQAGYRTFGVSDNPHVAPLRGFDRGFDRFAHASDSGSNVLNKRVKKWKDEIETQQPYFLYVHYMDPHMPYEHRQPWFRTYTADGKVREWLGQDKIAAYDSEINFVAERIRRLFTFFHWDDGDTLVMVTADHGEELADHGLHGHSHTLFGELVNVPLIFYDASGRFPARRVGARVSLVDVMPTLTELLGLEPAVTHVGMSLVPLLKGGQWTDDGRPLLQHLETYDTPVKYVLEGVIQDRWKLIRSDVAGDLLFDLQRDPREENTCLESHPEIAARLGRSYDELMARLPRYEEQMVPFSLSSENAEQLRALGYLQ